MGDTDWRSARVLRQQPKQSGNYSHWLNIQSLDGEQKDSALNWDRVEEWHSISTNDTNVEDTVLITATDDAQLAEIKQAKSRELLNLRQNNVYQVVPFQNQVVISSRWVITVKFVDGTRIIKARLVARGFEEDSSQFRIDSPTCTKESLRLVFIICSSMNWTLHSIDITAAFLQGEELERQVFLKPPRDVCPTSHVWLLKRCLYGLNDAPRAWYLKVKSTLLELGAILSVYDHCLFMWYDTQGRLIGVLVSHVDDFAFCGTEDFHSTVIEQLKLTLKVGSHEQQLFQYLGLQVEQDIHGVHVSQNDYIKSICPVKYNIRSRTNNDSSELTKDEVLDLKRLSGQLNWAASQTRPDLSYDVCAMSNIGKFPKLKLVKDANRALKKIKK